MDYISLFTTEAIFIVVIALWFARQLNWFSFLKSINDPKGILLPTITLLVGLIVIPITIDFYNSLSQETVILELIKSANPLIAIFIFFLGQFTVKKEKQRDREKQEKNIAYKMLNSLDRLISNEGSLYQIERKLKGAKPKDFDFSEFQDFCKNQLVEIERELKEAQTNEIIFTMNDERFLINYINMVKSFVRQIIDNIYSEQDMFNQTIWYLAKSNIILAYKHKIFIAKDIIKNPLWSKEIIAFLQSEKQVLNYFIERKNNIKRYYRQIIHDENTEMTEIERMEGNYYFLENNDDIELKLIEEIDKIINDFQ